MSHIKDRLSDYHDFMKKLVDDHQMVLASDVLEMIEQLQEDLEQDEKENGWIPVSERLPEEHGDSGYGYRQYPTPEKLQENQQRKIYPDESEGLLRIQTQDRRCTV